MPAAYAEPKGCPLFATAMMSAAARRNATCSSGPLIAWTGSIRNADAIQVATAVSGRSRSSAARWMTRP